MQPISKEEEVQIENNQGGGTKIRSITSRLWLFWKLLYVFKLHLLSRFNIHPPWILACTDFNFNRYSKENIPVPRSSRCTDIARRSDHLDALTVHGLRYLVYGSCVGSGRYTILLLLPLLLTIIIIILYNYHYYFNSTACHKASS